VPRRGNRSTSNAKEMLQYDGIILSLQRCAARAFGGLSQSATADFERAMPFVLNKTFRIKAAIAVALIYAVCILVPSAAFALAAHDAAAHCLIEDHGFAAPAHHGVASHVHADGVTHHHPDGGTTHKQTNEDGKGHAANCCGLFSVVAISGEPGITLGTLTLTSVPFAVLREALSGRGPDRINRPPIG
jgi:hypothetical protein